MSGPSRIPGVRYVLIPIAVLALAGCGGDGNDSGGGATTSAAAAGTPVTMSLVDFALEPKTVQLDAPGTYTFMVTNNGQTSHALEIEGNGVEDETDTLSPGDSGEVTVELAAGEYELYCPIDSHRANGMEGTLVVAGG
jgi:plastocyanin